MQRKASILCTCLCFVSFLSRSQDKVSIPDEHPWSSGGRYYVEIGAGLSTYEGDLKEKSSFLGQPGFAASLGGGYRLSKLFALNLGWSYMKLKADDQKNERAALKARNLNFQSKVWDLNVLLQWNMPFALHNVTPYFDAGVGLFHFNPTTVDRNGEKQYLQRLGTEGQGMLLYPDREYLLTQVQLPFGAGLQYRINNRTSLKLDFLFRKTFTDYIDDVSTTYPDPLLIDKKLAVVKQLAFRGDEIDPRSSYPANQQRGNPDQKDFYYTGQLKVVYQFYGRSH